MATENEIRWSRESPSSALLEKCHPLHRESKSSIIICVLKLSSGNIAVQYLESVWPQFNIAWISFDLQKHKTHDNVSLVMEHVYKLSTYRTSGVVFSLNHVPLVLSGETLKKWHTWKYHKFLLWYDLKLTVAEHLVSDCYHLFCHPSIHAYRISILISNFLPQKWHIWKYHKSYHSFASLFEHAASLREWMAFGSISIARKF